jgi:hypothetical protein
MSVIITGTAYFSELAGHSLPRAPMDDIVQNAGLGQEAQWAPDWPRLVFRIHYHADGAKEQPVANYSVRRSAASCFAVLRSRRPRRSSTPVLFVVLKAIKNGELLDPADIIGIRKHFGETRDREHQPHKTSQPVAPRRISNRFTLSHRIDRSRTVNAPETTSRTRVNCSAESRGTTAKSLTICFSEQLQGRILHVSDCLGSVERRT